MKFHWQTQYPQQRWHCKQITQALVHKICNYNTDHEKWHYLENSSSTEKSSRQVNSYIDR